VGLHRAHLVARLVEDVDVDDGDGVSSVTTTIAGQGARGRRGVTIQRASHAPNPASTP